jgi:hypothetical protein
VYRSKFNEGPFKSQQQFFVEAVQAAVNQYHQRAVEGTLMWWRE